MRRIATIGLWLALAGAPAFGGSLSVSLTTQGQPAADAVVWLVPDHPLAPADPVTASVVQRDRRFVPTITVVRTGTAIDFPNLDSTRHHVYSFSPTKSFELKLYVGRPAQTVTFDRAGVVVLGCNIHDTMVGYIVVVDTPHFAKTEAGRVVFDGLEAATYEVHFWHPPFIDTERSAGRVVIAASDAARLDLDLDALPSGGARR